MSPVKDRAIEPPRIFVTALKKRKIRDRNQESAPLRKRGWPQPRLRLSSALPVDGICQLDAYAQCPLSFGIFAGRRRSRPRTRDRAQRRPTETSRQAASFGTLA